MRLIKFISLLKCHAKRTLGKACETFLRRLNRQGNNKENSRVVCGTSTMLCRSWGIENQIKSNFGFWRDVDSSKMEDSQKKRQPLQNQQIKSNNKRQHFGTKAGECYHHSRQTEPFFRYKGFQNRSHKKSNAITEPAITE